MKKLLLGILLPLFLAGCGSDSDAESGTPLPDPVNVSVSVRDNFTVKPGEEFTIEAFGSFTPYHPDVELKYTWSKTTYPKPALELLDDFGGDAGMALDSLVTDADFSSDKTITEIAPTLYEGGYVVYTVQIGAKGYYIDPSQPNDYSLDPKSARYLAFVRVYVVE